MNEIITGDCRTVMATLQEESEKDQTGSEDPPPPTTTEKSCYGHRTGTIAEKLDILVSGGGSLDKMAAKLAKDLDKEESAMKARLANHIRYLAKTKEVKVEVKEGKVVLG